MTPTVGRLVAALRREGRDFDEVFVEDTAGVILRIKEVVKFDNGRKGYGILIVTERE